MRQALLLLIILAATTGLAPAAPITFDFEDGTLQGWTVVEGSFGMLVCDRELFHHQTELPYNNQGTYFLSTLETPDYAPSDHYTGIVESPVVRLEGETVQLLVGGGSGDSTYVGLFDLAGRELARATGADTQEMKPITWTVPEAVGELVLLRVVDQATGSWGHLTIDDVRLEGIVDEQATEAYRR
ncbi:MAG: hypothetical protein GF320_21530, partial [Armatimonadia bacterium]|nr:hypothetical protein [Armatimonadia bacterium]